VKISGIDPEDEKQVTNLYSKLIEGTYFEDGKRNPIIIGKKLAEKLRVKLRSKVVITLQDMQGNMTALHLKWKVFMKPPTRHSTKPVFLCAGLIWPRSC
jgi:ABC-type lipoprotein release transport system permease subunit